MKHSYNLRLLDEANAIDRQDAAALIQEQYADEIAEGAVARSAVFAMGMRLNDMTSGQMTIPVMGSLPIAYFQNGDMKTKKLTKMKWDKKKITGEYITVIIPIANQVLDDTSYDLRQAIVPRAQEAIGKAIDAAVLFSTNKPDTWPEGIVQQAEAAGAIVVSGLSMYDDLLGVGGVFSKVEESGYDVTGNVAATGVKASLRSIKDNNGHPIFLDNMTEEVRYSLAGTPIFFAKNGSFTGTNVRMISGDFSELVYSICKDINVRVLDQATLIDPSTNEILYALPQQNMFALLIEMRMGWQLPNPVNAENDTESRFPFAILKAAGENVMALSAHNVDGAGNTYTEAQLQSMTIDQIKAVAAAEGYEITKTVKAEIIAEFMAAQAAKSVG